MADRVDSTEQLIDRLLVGVKAQLAIDGNSVPPWLIPLLAPMEQNISAPPSQNITVPRIDTASGHTIGRVVYSPTSQKPRTIVSTHIVKEEDEEDDSEFIIEMIYYCHSNNFYHSTHIPTASHAAPHYVRTAHRSCNR